MNKFFKYKWAVDGETVSVPDAVDPSGFVSYRQGYGGDYSRVYGTDPLAKPQERTKLNAVLQDITGEIQSLQVHGFPDYITSALNGGTAYAYDIGAVVRWTDDQNYINTVAGNTDDPSVDGWVLYNDPASAINSATAKTTPVDADEFGIADSAASWALKKVTWANIKTALTSVFAPIASPAFTGTPTAPTASAGTGTTQIATTAFVKTKSEADSIGVNQTWQDMTASRALGTTYTNSSGKPIMISFTSANSSGQSVAPYATVDGYSFNISVIIASATSQSFVGTFIVPTGSTYSITSQKAITKWSELR